MYSGAHVSAYSENLMVHFRRIEVLRREACHFASFDLGSRQLCDLELLLSRALYPLEGYLGRLDYESVLENMRLADGTLWAMPLCLDVDDQTAAALEPGKPLALRDSEGFMLAVLHVSDVWQPDKEQEACAIYGTSDASAHPGVRRLYNEYGGWYVSGRVEGLHFPQHYDFAEFRLTPSDVHRRFSQRGWRNVVGFQTAAWPHCAHREMMLGASQEAEANLFIMIDNAQARDADHFTLVRSYRKFIERFPRGMATMALVPYATRYAGPREALWQAQIRRNYGCTHVAVGDTACDPFKEGKAPFYPAGEGVRLAREFAEEIGVEVVRERPRHYVEELAQYVPVDDVTEEMNVREITCQELVRRLEFGLEIPEWFSYPEVVEELRKAYPPRHRQGFTLLLTGLSGAGKSTLAKVLYVKFKEMNGRPVSLLDGDIVRRNLSSELSFSREHRNLNVTRIGFVASEITKNRGIAICAPIAPYQASREAVREMVGAYGGYVEIHMSTPLEVCERRDRKGLYAKARAGILKGVTGIDDPYEPPENPELRIDTTEKTPSEAAQDVLRYLAEQGYIR